MMKKGYTQKEAVRDELASIPVGLEFNSADFYGRVIRRMRFNGNFDRPLQETISRRTRDVRAEILAEGEFEIVRVKDATYVKRYQNREEE